MRHVEPRGFEPRHPPCKSGALPTELWPRSVSPEPVTGIEPASAALRVRCSVQRELHRHGACPRRDSNAHYRRPQRRASAVGLRGRVLRAAADRELGAVTFRVGWVATPDRRATVDPSHGSRRAASAVPFPAPERPAGIEPAAPVWKTGVSAEFTRTAWGWCCGAVARPGVEPRSSGLRVRRSTFLSLTGVAAAWTWAGSNRRPPPCRGGALPTALQAQRRRAAVRRPAMVFLSSAVELRKISAAGNRSGRRYVR